MTVRSMSPVIGCLGECPLVVVLFRPTFLERLHLHMIRMMLSKTYMSERLTTYLWNTFSPVFLFSMTIS
jgi:hypothetical protein